MSLVEDRSRRNSANLITFIGLLIFLLSLYIEWLILVAFFVSEIIENFHEAVFTLNHWLLALGFGTAIVTFTLYLFGIVLPQTWQSAKKWAEVTH